MVIEQKCRIWTKLHIAYNCCSILGTIKRNTLVILENPEAHLHPRGQTEMGKLIASVAHSGCQVIVETHSDHLFDGIRIYAKIMKDLRIKL